MHTSTLIELVKHLYNYVIAIQKYRDLIGLQRMIMVRKKSKYIFIIFYNGPDKCIYVSLVSGMLAYVRGKVFIRITVHYPVPGHYFNTSNSDRSSRRI